MNTELKRIDIKSKKFTANNHNYRIAGSLSIDRYKEFEKLEIHVGFGTTFERLFATLKEIDGHLNKVEFSKAAVKNHNLMNGIAQKLDNRTHPVLEICALFINREGEDIRVFDQVINDEKIADWQKEGFMMDDFFQLAFSLVQGYSSAYRELSQSTSEKGKEMQDILSGSSSK